MSKSDSIVTPKRLRELLEYDAATGLLTWRVNRKGTVKAGDVAGSPAAGGYLNISIDWRLYKAHRLAWLYVYGEWPAQQIDHINGDPMDNRIANLRDVSPTVNTQNQRLARSDNRSGVMGTRERDGRWIARIGLSGKRQKHLGMFDTQAEAHEAYLEAKRLLHEGCTI